MTNIFIHIRRGCVEAVYADNTPVDTTVFVVDQDPQEDGPDAVEEQTIERLTDAPVVIKEAASYVI